MNYNEWVDIIAVKRQVTRFPTLFERFQKHRFSSHAGTTSNIMKKKAAKLSPQRTFSSFVIYKLPVEVKFSRPKYKDWIYEFIPVDQPISCGGKDRIAVT